MAKPIELEGFHTFPSKTPIMQSPPVFGTPRRNKRIMLAGYPRCCFQPHESWGRGTDAMPEHRLATQ